MSEDDPKHHRTGDNRETSEDSGEVRSKGSRLMEFSEDEVSLIAKMFRLVGNRWSLIAGRIPGRTAEEIEKYWTSRNTTTTTTTTTSSSLTQ